MAALWETVRTVPNNRGPRRFDSGVLELRKAAAPDGRSAALATNFGRWSEATVAASYTYASDFRSNVAEWADLLDELEEGITRAEIRSCSRLIAARANDGQKRDLVACLPAPDPRGASGRQIPR